MLTDKCIDSSLIEGGDLTAYLYGDASPQIVNHIAQCAFCAEQVEQLRMVDAQLLASFYRQACPTSEELADFIFKRLPLTAKIRVAAHVRSCDSCKEDMATVRDLLHEEPPSLLSRLRESLTQALVAQPLARVATFARGEGWRGRFEANGLVITLTFQAGGLTSRVRRRGDSTKADYSGQAWLLSPEMEAVQRIPHSAIDEQGYFQFTGLAPGSYTLLLQVGEQNVAVSPIEIKR